MFMVDGNGKRLEVIILDCGHGPQQWIRVSWHGVLLGDGYYRTIDDVLELVDAASLVEVISHPASARGQQISR